MKQKAETGERKAKTRGVMKQGCKEWEDGEGKKLSLTAAVRPTARMEIVVGSVIRVGL
jgi:hypothetical protein